ncbi:RNase adapter RapZ [Acidiphilium sp. PA]|uniref:RNase adapter RapZ n=1 Tax=Acidiphilium sp. PA TaxID=2871705 RepID=UPI00224313EA|nr:RNase adapter RapZ [Acidiphilium sp. PA]MCW8306514.1 RNase adapter RapZ [Acidiphilium sp. PA]
MSTPNPRLIVVSGLSGAGKNSVLRALEDLGYEAVDNPPLRLVETLIGAAKPLAVGLDARNRDFSAADILDTLARLRLTHVVQPELIFAIASDEVLQRRFTETRRRHPLALQGTVREGIATEQALTRPLRDAADWVVDTSDLPLATLRQMIETRFGTNNPGLAITLASFAFPAGIPREADLVFDARFLRNPHYIPDLRPQTGLDRPVRAYIETDPDYAEFIDRVAGLVKFLLPRFVREGKKYAMVAIGCTGGRHRSVASIEALGDILRSQSWVVQIDHTAIRSEISGRDLNTTMTGPNADQTASSAPSVRRKAANLPSAPGKSGEVRRHFMSGASK